MGNINFKETSSIEHPSVFVIELYVLLKNLEFRKLANLRHRTIYVFLAQISGKVTPQKLLAIQKLQSTVD